MKIWPFSDGDTLSAFRHLIEKTVAEIRAFDNNRFLQASSAELEQYFMDKVAIEPLVLRVDEAKGETEGINVDVSGDFRRGYLPGERAVVRGTLIAVKIPYEGDSDLWRLRASTFSVSGYRELEITNSTVSFSVHYADDDANEDEIQKQIDRELSGLATAVGRLNSDIDRHNREAPEEIRRALAHKKQQAELSLGVLGKLTIPITRKGEAPTFAAPVKRRPSPALPPVAIGKYESEPTLAEEEYQHILKITRSMSLVMERSPADFVTLGEEAIRMHFLIQLNGHYEGGATGETFNHVGKTDILIRSGDRNVFIAECKFWKGPKGFNETIDQLLGYLTWRDTKCALLIFNQNKDSISVREKMHETMIARAECKKVISHDPNADSRYILVKPDEPGREIIVTTQLYDVPLKN